MTMWLLFGALAGGWVMGWGACDIHYHAQKEVVKDTHRKECEELGTEIKRLRAQVAKWVGHEGP